MIAAWLSGLWIIMLLLSVMVHAAKGPAGLMWVLRGMGWGFAIGAVIAWSHP